MIKNRIKEFRARYDMKQDDLAKAVGVRRETIGLSNIYMRVHIFYENQGDMEIYSTEGKGTMVRILLPVAVKEVYKGEKAECTEL